MRENHFDPFIGRSLPIIQPCCCYRCTIRDSELLEHEAWKMLHDSVKYWEEQQGSSNSHSFGGNLIESGLSYRWTWNSTLVQLSVPIYDDMRCLKAAARRNRHRHGANREMNNRPDTFSPTRIRMREENGVRMKRNGSSLTRQAGNPITNPPLKCCMMRSPFLFMSSTGTASSSSSMVMKGLLYCIRHIN